MLYVDQNKNGLSHHHYFLNFYGATMNGTKEQIVITEDDSQEGATKPHM